MEELITLTEYNWAFWVAGTYALVEFLKWLVKTLSVFHEWLFKKIGIETKKMREKREWEERLKNAEDAIAEIKNTSKQNVEMFLAHEKQVVGQFVDIRNEIVTELNKLHDKVDKTNEANAKTDRAMLRDRIASGMRYFSKNVDDQGRVHIAFGDYVNMDELFQEYFAHDGNGPFKKMYEDEFKHFIIDR
jgi:glutamine synthetase type III